MAYDPTTPIAPVDPARVRLRAVVAATAVFVIWSTLVLSAGSASASHPGHYWLVGADGGVFAFGQPYLGSTGGRKLNSRIVGMAPTTAGAGYWLAAADGGVFAFGKARFSGSMGGTTLRQPIVGIAATYTGAGYWLVARDGGVFAFGDATFAGSLARLRLRQPVVGISVSPGGKGYWIVTADGGVFAFGDAPFFGSAAGRNLTAPIVGIGSTYDGYVLAGADGSVHAFGGASLEGSLTDRRLTAPVVGIQTYGDGYWLTTADGGVFAFGDAAQWGAGPRPPLASPVVGMAIGLGFSEGESILPGAYREHADEFSTITYKPGAAPLLESLHGDCFCSERMWMSVGWKPQDDGTVGVVAKMQNTTGVPLRFPDGLNVTFHISKDGNRWRDVDAAVPSIREIKPGGMATVSTSVQLEPEGRFHLDADTFVIID